MPTVPTCFFVIAASLAMSIPFFFGPSGEYMIVYVHGSGLTDTASTDCGVSSHLVPEHGVFHPLLAVIAYGNIVAHVV